ncbi:ATP-binding protein [Kitasatospora sp. NPDC006697]|uniref:ATP-binding protein n=1 Tax=Kitasatospora sp. NPDC006697 TaxID=3364020 RepID=UPI0036954D63
MGLDGTQSRQGRLLDPTGVPRQGSGGATAGLRTWLAVPRPEAPGGIYRYGYLAPEPGSTDDERPISGPLLLWRALVGVGAYVFGYLCVSWLVLNVLGFLGWFNPKTVSADQFSVIELLISIAILIALIPSCARLGRWVELYRRFLSPAGFRRNLLPTLSKAVTDERRDKEAAAAAEAALAAQDPWQALRRAGLGAALGQLDEDTRAGRVTDVDYVRILRVHGEVAAEPGLAERFAEQVAGRGAAACVHPSQARDVAGRVAEHDLLVGQVRLGTAQDVVKNPQAHRGAGFALDRSVLATSLLAVGPAGTGKTVRLARPVAEALCLQALARTACAVVVGAAEAELGPDSGYDVVIAPGDPASAYGLDLYGAASDPDAAAARLADALLPDELSARSESARIALQQVVGPFHAAHGRYPGLRELRALLGGEESAWKALVERLTAAGQWELYEPDVQQRRDRLGRADDPGALLADRLALLDRPAFAGCFEQGAAATRPAFAMRALEHPLRVRVKLPERSHPEAARILSRLVVGQFLQAAAARTDRSLFAGLVVDDAAAALDGAAVQGLRRLPGANAGAVLLLRSLVDLPESLRMPLFGAVGCRMAFPGIAPWDGALFSEAWGTVLVRERAVTLAPDTSGGMLRKTGRVLRKVLAGTAAQTESVTTREVERQRWTPSDLAHALPTGHAVVSLTSVTGEQVPPLLVDLRS